MNEPAPETILLQTFDECVNVRPHLFLEIGFNRIADWGVVIYDATGVGIRNAEIVVRAQSPERDDAFAQATQQLREKYLS